MFRRYKQARAKRVHAEYVVASPVKQYGSPRSVACDTVTLQSTDSSARKLETRLDARNVKKTEH